MLALEISAVRSIRKDRGPELVLRVSESISHKRDSPTETANSDSVPIDLCHVRRDHRLPIRKRSSQLFDQTLADLRQISCRRRCRLR